MKRETRLLKEDIKTLSLCYGIVATQPKKIEEKIIDVILQEQISAGSSEEITIDIILENKVYKESFLYLRNGYFKRV